MKYSKMYYFSISIYINRKHGVQFLARYYHSIIKELKEKNDTFWVDFQFSNYKGENLNIDFYSNQRESLKEIKPYICSRIKKFIDVKPVVKGGYPIKIDKLFLDFPPDSIVVSKIYKMGKDPIFEHINSYNFNELIINLLQKKESNEEGFIEYWCIHLFILNLIIGFEQIQSCSYYLNSYYSKLTTENNLEKKSLQELERESKKISLNMQDELNDIVMAFRNNVKMNNPLDGNFNSWGKLFKQFNNFDEHNKSTEQFAASVFEELYTKLGGDWITYIHIIYLLKVFFGRLYK